MYPNGSVPQALVDTSWRRRQTALKKAPRRPFFFSANILSLLWEPERKVEASTPAVCGFQALAILAG